MSGALKPKGVDVVFTGCNRLTILLIYREGVGQ
jgi:hypothetical protein